MHAEAVATPLVFGVLICQAHTSTAGLGCRAGFRFQALQRRCGAAEGREEQLQGSYAWGTSLQVHSMPSTLCTAQEDCCSSCVIMPCGLAARLLPCCCHTCQYLMLLMAVLKAAQPQIEVQALFTPSSLRQICMGPRPRTLLPQAHSPLHVQARQMRWPSR